jgi:hypothetical protein
MLPQIITDIAGINLSGAAQTLANNLIARLESAYPAFAGMWRVTVNEKGGTVEVTNMALSGRWGFLMHIAKIDPEGRKVVRAGGELLERYRISRSQRVSVAMDSLRAAPRNFRSELVPDRG